MVWKEAKDSRERQKFEGSFSGEKGDRKENFKVAGERTFTL
jgi:hypothetical protein